MPPNLTWETKKPSLPINAHLQTESVIFPKGAGYTPTPILDDYPNRLISGDNLAVMSALMPEFEGNIPLIYVDPPFFSNRHYPARIGRGEDSRRPKEWQLAEGYTDHWQDIDAYLDMLYPRLVLMHRLLSPTGTLYLHLDWHANAYARLLLVEIFWRRSIPK
jgi:site-specific DNA-methyltransferase (adenine-specific)